MKLFIETWHAIISRKLSHTKHRDYMTTLIYKDNIEKLLRICLPYFFGIVFLSTIAGALVGYLQHNPWKIGDWLINYQGGMVRRGFLGELIYQLSSLTDINPGIYVFILQVFLYAVFFFFSYLLLKRQDRLLPYALLIFSPFIFSFQINDLQGGFRKEIIYFALLAFVVWSANAKQRKAFDKILYVTLLLYPAIILTHEMLAIFLPYILVVYVSIRDLTVKNLILISFLLLPSAASLLVAIQHPGTSYQASRIFNSLTQKHYVVTGGAIYWLGKDLFFGMHRVINLLMTANYAHYIILGLLASVAYVPIYNRLKSILKNKLSLTLVLLSAITSVGIFAVAIDWGRFIYIHLVSVFLISLLPIKGTSLDDNDHGLIRFSQPPQAFSGLKLALLIVFFVLYTSLWHLPHCCQPKTAYAKTYKQVNIVAFARPYVRVLALLHNSKT